MSVYLRFSGNTDCHTSDIGHWFAMTKTNFVYHLTSLWKKGANKVLEIFYHAYYPCLRVTAEA